MDAAAVSAWITALAQSPHLLLSTHLPAQVPQLLTVQLVPAPQLRGSRREAGLRAFMIASVQPWRTSDRLRSLIPAQDIRDCQQGQWACASWST